MLRAYLILVLGVVVAAVCARLGLWQVARLHQRLALKTTIAARLRSDTVDLIEPIPTDTNARNALAYRPARARGTFDYEREIIVIARSLNGTPGAYVATALRLPNGSAVLVERGWRAGADVQASLLPALREGTELVEATGVLIVPGAGKQRPRLGSAWPLYTPTDAPVNLASRFAYPLLPWVLRRTTRVPGMPAELLPIPPPALDHGPHLSYAIQWFAFGVIALVGSVALFLGERRMAKRGRDETGEAERGDY